MEFFDDGLTRNFQLAWDLAKRDINSKYRRSLIGLIWLVLTPFCLLCIYTLIFGGMFGISWQQPVLRSGNSGGFVLPFFVGLSMYLFLSDVVNSSSILFVSKRVFIIKSSFPIWVLWVSNLFRASVHAFVLLVLLLGLALVQQKISFSGLAWFFLGIFLCGIFLSALSLLLAALGPFIGDISESMRLLLRVLFYVTPITYPITMIPIAFRDWIWVNPLTCMVELLREPLVFGQMAPLNLISGFALFSALLLIFAIWVFNRLKGVISDVV